jgi:hypothetical protein
MLPTKSKFHRGTGWLANGNEGPRLARTQGENLLFFRRLARPEGFEPPTPTFVALYSIQLSYGRAQKANLTRIARGCDRMVTDWSLRVLAKWRVLCNVLIRFSA